VPVEIASTAEVEANKSAAGVSGRQVSVQMLDLFSPEEISRYFARSDHQKRQLVIWSGYQPMILQRVEYYDRFSPVHGAFAGKFNPR